MFEYSKIKDELEQIRCPAHGKTATVKFVDGKINFENVCCDEHRKRLEQSLPELEERQYVGDIMEDVF